MWKRDVNNNWENLVYQDDLETSVNCIAWAPWEYGLILAAGLADGRVVIYARDPSDQWAKTNDFLTH